MFLLKDDFWQIKKTKEKGFGIFCKKEIKAGTIIGDYIGKVVKTADVDIEKDKQSLYLMYYHDQAVIYPNLQKVGIHLLNHSCTPNSWLYTFRGHSLVFTLRHIFAGEELTISYLLSPKDEFCNPCTHLCNCQSFMCKKTMHLSAEKYKTWRSFQEARAKYDKRGRIRYGKELQLLSKYPKTIPDDPIYDLFGNTKKPPISFAAKTLPPLKEIRRLIRKTGRTIDFPALNIKIYGVLNNIVISKEIPHHLV